jgi:hypothetical protein
MWHCNRVNDVFINYTITACLNYKNFCSEVKFEDSNVAIKAQTRGIDSRVCVCEEGEKS